MAQTNTAKSFWDSVTSFPLGLYCEDFRYHYKMGNLAKDCATCNFLSFGRCSKGKMPNKVGLKQKP